MASQGIHRTGLVLITLLVLGVRPVHGEWIAVDRNDRIPRLQTVYVDPATIRREGHQVTLWQLTDYTWMQGGRKSTRFLSTTTHKQFDCVEQRFRLLAYAEFLRHMGTGRRKNGYVDQDTWLPVEPESVNYALWEVACGKE